MTEKVTERDRSEGMTGEVTEAATEEVQKNLESKVVE